MQDDRDDDPVQLDATRAGLAVITLNRPDRHNAFNPQMILALRDIFEDLRGADGVRAVMLKGAGRSFCAGADLAWMRAAADYSAAENREDAENLAQMLLALRRLPQATVACIQGAAIAGGMGLVAACDIAIATRGASFGLSEARLGIAPATIAPYVIEAIGPRAARRYMVTAERFSAEEAYRLGLVHVLTEDEGALAVEAERIVAEIFQCAPGAVAACKELVEELSFEPVDDDLALDTAEIIAQLRVDEEGQEGLRAFLEKRKPRWAG